MPNLHQRSASAEERKFCVPQPKNLIGPTGCICRLFGRLNDLAPRREIYTELLFTKSFASELTVLLNDVLMAPGHVSHVLSSSSALLEYCKSHPETFYCSEDGHSGYCYTCWTDNYAYMILLNPEKPTGFQYHIMCYLRNLLEIHMQSASKGIQFMNASCIPTFRIQDGDAVCIRSSTTKEPFVVCTCRFLSDSSIDIGGQAIYALEFALKLEREHNEVFPMRASLPDMCFYYVEESGQLAEIRKGAKAPVVSVLSRPNDPEWNGNHAIGFNAAEKVSHSQEMAMVHGCLYGWGKPEADPDYYTNKNKKD